MSVWSTRTTWAASSRRTRTSPWPSSGRTSAVAAHVNLSGIGVIRGSDRRAAATSLLEFLESPDQQRVFVDNNKEFAVAPGVERRRARPLRGASKRDPIDVERGANLDDAVHLMNEVEVTVVTLVAAVLVAGPLIEAAAELRGRRRWRLQRVLRLPARRT